MDTLDEVYCLDDVSPARCVCDFNDHDGTLRAVLIFSADPFAQPPVRYLLTFPQETWSPVELPDDPFKHLEEVAGWLRRHPDPVVEAEWRAAAGEAYVSTRAQAIAVARRHMPQRRRPTQKKTTRRRCGRGGRGVPAS